MNLARPKRPLAQAFGAGAHSDSDSHGSDSDGDYGGKRARHGGNGADGGIQYIAEIEGTELHSSSSRKKKAPLVIPLIRENVWRAQPGQDGQQQDQQQDEQQQDQQQQDQDQKAVRELFPSERQPAFGLQVFKPKDASADAASQEATADVDMMDAVPEGTIEEQAMRALVAEADGTAPKGPKTAIHMPLLVQNAVPGLDHLESDVDKYRHDVAMRPEESSLDDYKRVPIEDFGEAMLRGMGWVEGKAVGKNGKGLIAPIVAKPRPRLLGLGAKPAPEVEEKKKRFIKPGEKRKPNPVAARPAQQSTDVPRNKEDRSDNGRKASPSGPSTSHKGDLQPGTRVKITEGRHAGKTGVVSSIKSKPDGDVVDVVLDKSGDKARVWLQDVVEMKSTSSKPSDSPSNAPSSDASKRSWLRPHLRVRIISKSYRSGRFYNTKGLIQDVVRAGECVVRMDNGSDVLDDVRQRYLETYIPAAGKQVMVVDHKDRGMVGWIGKILEKNSDKNQAIVQFDHDFSIETLSYDDICEFVE
ncbi:DExH-box splicing factor binding site-domain-containing protein [Entophlyctis helioformis]|nr:DExH-box splicing factor binding site-domain-containing protein [Entophlyctis helioformis]